MPLEQALEIDDSCGGLSGWWTELGWAAVGSREWHLHPQVFLIVVCLHAVILGDASGASSGI